LAAGASTTCEITVVLTQAQVDAGELDGATVTASTSQGASAEAADSVKTTLPGAPAVTFDKTADVKPPVKAGGKVSYSFKAVNTGNATEGTARRGPVDLRTRPQRTNYGRTESRA